MEKNKKNGCLSGCFVLILLLVALGGCVALFSSEDDVTTDSKTTESIRVQPVEDQKKENTTTQVSEHNQLMAVKAGLTLYAFGVSVSENPTVVNTVASGKEAKDLLGSIKLEYNTSGDDEFNEKLVHYIDTAWDAMSLAIEGAINNDPQAIAEATEMLASIQKIPPELEAIIKNNQ